MICFNFCDAHNKWSLDIWTIDWDATSGQMDKRTDGQTDTRTSGRINRIQISEFKSEWESESIGDQRPERPIYTIFDSTHTHTQTDNVCHAQQNVAQSPDLSFGLAVFTQLNSTRLNSIWFDSLRFGSFWFALVWFGSTHRWICMHIFALAFRLLCAKHLNAIDI